MFTVFRYQGIRGAGRRVERERNTVLVAEDGACLPSAHQGTDNPGRVGEEVLIPPKGQVIHDHRGTGSGNIVRSDGAGPRIVVGRESTAVAARTHVDVVSGLNVV